MNKVIFIFILGLFIAGTASAAENTSKHADKIIYTLKKLDMYDPAMKDAIMFIDERIDNGHFAIDEERVLGFDAKLQYDVHSVNINNIQLQFKDSEHPNYEFVATPSGAMLRYSAEF